MSVNLHVEFEETGSAEGVPAVYHDARDAFV